MISTIQFNENLYPAFQAQGYAAQFAIPFALHVCKGVGYDIGCKNREWSFPDSIMIDISIEDPYDAMNLPPQMVDYIFSSHCLEHLQNWVDALDYWTEHLKPGGTLFLYLPHYNQEYWRPWNNRKHIHAFTQNVIVDYLEAKGYQNIFHSGVDLNSSFIVMGEK